MYVHALLRSLKCVAITVEQAHCRLLTVNLCPLAIWNQFCIEKSRWERESCPLSGIQKRPLLGGYVSIKVMLDTIRNTTVVRCREAVLFSEGRLSEAQLYQYKKLAYPFPLHLLETSVHASIS